VEWKEGSGNGASLFMGGLSGEPGGVKEECGDGHLFPWGPHWEAWKNAHIPEASVWKKVLEWVSLPIGAPMGNLGRRIHLLGTLRIS
jgi:hypothetical protein